MRSVEGFVSEWCSLETKDKLLSMLRLGDLLEIKREIYCHWAVCVSLGQNPLIVHRSGDGSGCLLPTSSNKASASFADKKKGGCEIGVVEADELWTIVGDSRVRINNSLDKKRKAKTAEQIVVTALESIRKDVNGGYDLIRNNCEHFAHYCRYGECLSNQVVKGVIKVLSGAAFAVVLGVGIVINIAARR